MSLKEHFKTFLNLEHFKKIVTINLLFFLFFLISDSLDVFVPLYLKSQNMPAINLGLLQSATLILRMFVVMLIAKPTLKTKKNILMIFIIINMINIFWIPRISNHFYFYYVFGLLMVSRSIFNGTMNPTLAKLLPDQLMGLGFGIRDVFLNLGSFLGLILSGLVTKHFGNSGFYLFISTALVFLLLVLAMLKPNFEVKINSEYQKESSGPSKSSAFHSLPRNYKVNFIRICLIGICLSFGKSAEIYLPNVANDIGFMDEHIFYLFSSSVLLTSFLSFAGGMIIDIFNKKHLYYAYILVSFLSVLFLSLHNKLFFSLSLFLIGINGVLDNIEQTYFFEFYKSFNLDGLWAINAAVQMGASFFVPTFMGFLYDIGFQAMIISCFIFLLISLFLSFGLKLKRSVGKESYEK